jgi:hypothetical protein
MPNDRNAELQRARYIKRAHDEFRRQVESYIPAYPPTHPVRVALEPCVNTLGRALNEEIRRPRPSR